MRVYLFGDQGEDCSAGLHTLLLSKQDPISDVFLKQSYNVIRREILRYLYSTAPSFSSLLDIVRWRNLGIRNLAVEHALGTIYQIAIFMRHLHKHKGVYPNPSDTILVGVCTGSITAAAISCCQSLSELLPCALEAVTVSFRVGHLVEDVASRTEVSTSTGASWALAIPGSSKDNVMEIVRCFKESHMSPVASQPYISGVSFRSVAVSGPPSTIDQFRQFETISSLKSIQLSLHAPYHAPHLYSTQDIRAILSSSTFTISKKEDSDIIPILSATTGIINASVSIEYALEVAVREILCEKLRLDLILDSLGTKILGSDHTANPMHIIIPIVTSTAQGLAFGLQEKDVHIRVTTDPGSELESAIPLSTQYAFHSAQVDCILEDYISQSRNTIYRTPSVPVICPLQGKVIDKCGVLGSEHLAAHCRGQVNIIGAMETAQSQGILPRNCNILEVGDHQTFSNMLKSIFRKDRPDINILPSLIKHTDTWKTISEVLASPYMAGVNVNWREYHREFASALDVVPLPAYSWDLKPYWIQYVNDWSLRKGDPSISCQYEDRKTTVPPLLNTTIYNIVREEVGQMSGSLIVQLDLSKDNAKPLVQGHKVNGIPLCTPSVYADIALTLGTYLQKRYRPAERQKQAEPG